jgi:hypothetical protein
LLRTQKEHGKFCNIEEECQLLHGGIVKIKEFVLIIILLLTAQGCSASSEILGTVVDAETGESIERAVVLVEWTKTKGFGLTHTESYKVVEVLTDKDGKFKVPGVRTIFVDSHLTIYKKGYVAWNNEVIFPGYRKRTDFEWGKTNTFKLENFKQEYSYIDHTAFLSSVIHSGMGKKDMIEDAYYWEELEASKERDKRRK